MRITIPGNQGPMTTRADKKKTEQGQVVEPNRQTHGAEPNRQTPDSLRQPVWHVAVLGIFSFGLYLIYWFYKTWRDLKHRALIIVSPNPDKAETCPEASEEEKRVLEGYANVRPWLRSMAFFLPLFLSPLLYTPLNPVADTALKYGWPILMVFLFANLFKDIASLIPDSDSWAGTNPIQAGFALGLAVPFCLNLSGANGAAYLLYLLVVIPIGLAQNWLNQYWEKTEKDTQELKALRTAFSFKETLVIILGALWMGLVLLDLLQVK